jgi:hypothetical protein
MRLQEKGRGKKLGLPQHSLVFMRDAGGFLLAMSTMDEKLCLGVSSK